MAELHRSRLEVAGVNGRLAELSLHLKEEKSQWSKERAGLLQSMEVEGRGGPGRLTATAPTSMESDPLGRETGMRSLEDSGVGRGSEGGTIHCPKYDPSVSRVSQS